MYGMIGYVVPHSIYAAGYHCDPSVPLSYACLASQKNYMSLYLSCVYCDVNGGDWFREEWIKATGKKPNMGKSCVRIKSLDDVPLKVVAQAIKLMPVKKYIEFYENALALNEKARRKRSAGKKSADATSTRNPTGKSRIAKGGKTPAASRASSRSKKR